MSAIVIDVADGFRDAWAADGTLNGAIPVARCYFIQAPANTTIPYAVFNIEPSGEPQYSTGVTTYIVNVIVRLSVYGTGVVSSLQAIMDAAQAVFDSTFTISDTTCMATFLADAGRITVDGESNGEPVYRCDAGWKLMLSRNDG